MAGTTEVAPRHRAARFIVNTFWTWLGVGVALFTGFLLSPYLMLPRSMPVAAPKHILSTRIETWVSGLLSAQDFFGRLQPFADDHHFYCTGQSIFWYITRQRDRVVGNQAKSDA
jgi:hypothetical protein